MKLKCKYLKILFLCIVTILLGTGCSKKKQLEPITRTSFKLNTVVTITIYDSQDESLLDESMKICDKYETIFSRTNESSELYQLNHGLLKKSSNSTSTVSDELVDLINRGLHYCDLSNGTFDITVADLSALWDFTGDSPSVPKDKSIEALLPYIDYHQVKVTDNEISTSNDQVHIDLGGIAKGYIADRIKDYLVSQGVKSGMINLGGNVLCIGEKPDNTPFKVGIQKPFADRNETIAVMEIKDKSVVSSGVYERFFEEDGVLYHHILNPATGYPYNNDLISVTIISDLSVDGDGLSTSCFALGLEKGMDLINSLEDTYAVFITSDYKLHYSEGFLDAIPVTDISEQSK